MKYCIYFALSAHPRGKANGLKPPKVVFLLSFLLFKCLYILKNKYYLYKNSINCILDPPKNKYWTLPCFALIKFINIYKFNVSI